MSVMSKFKTLSKAKESFSSAKYEDAMNQFAQVLQSYPNSKEAFNGVILSDMAINGEGGAEALFDYYEILKEEDRESADLIMNDILQNMDGTLEKLTEAFSKPIKERLEYEDGILYEDFKDIIRDGESFKVTFENIMFSTKVIITQKEDFLDFLENLIDNDFKEMAISYLENALNTYPGDLTLEKLFNKLSQKAL